MPNHYHLALGACRATYLSFPVSSLPGYIFQISTCYSRRPYYVGGPVVAFIPAVVGVTIVPFEDAVADGLAVTCFPAVDGVFAVASFPEDPGVPILAGGFALL